MRDFYPASLPGRQPLSIAGPVRPPGGLTRDQHPASMKFTRQEKLTSQAEFSYVFARPLVSRDGCFRILARANDLGHSRLGMAVSRKVCKHAVGRNRLKRVTRESFRLHCLPQATRPGMDVVVLPSSQAATICNQELHASLAAHWSKLHQKVQQQTQQTGTERRPVQE